jgi:ubiquinone/menaquinone biosynthesis C-methylase UbiE
MKQKDHFITGEGDAWFNRNCDAITNKKLPNDDFILSEILCLPPPPNIYRVLEIGCSNGLRLEWLINNLGWQCSGLDPSAKAVNEACKRGVDAHQGTADRLPFPASSFDIVVFGFCLYLCDRDDLFRIAYEADRVCANPGWLIIHDFYSPLPCARVYHHLEGLFSYKMDYRNLFLWHPEYTCFKHTVSQHGKSCYTDDQQEWVATSVLRKCLIEPEK